MKKEFIDIFIKLVITIILVIVAGYVGIFFGIILWADNLKDWLINVCLVGYAVLSLTIISRVWTNNFIKKTRYVPVIIIGISLITFTVNKIIVSFDDSIPTLNDQGVKLSYYEPFKNEGTLVKLTEPSTLKLDGNLPRLDCSTALYPVLAGFVQATYPNGDYDPYKGDGIFSQSNTSEAYARLVKDDVDIILVSPPSKTQLEQMKSQGIELNLTPIGKEAFVFFVNSKNPIDNLTVEQVKNIYSGKITNWQDVGGKNEKIRAFQRSKDSGSQTALEKMMGDIPLMKPPSEDINDLMSGIVELTSDYKNYGNAIGFSFRYFSTEMVKNKLIKLIKLNGIYPDKETIRNGEYPIASEFYAVTIKGKETENTTKFIEWMQSGQGQYIVEETGYVAINHIGK